MVAANRDEYYARPALPAHWWADTDHGNGNGIFGGRDLTAQGTWLAISQDGRLAAVTNWSEDRNAVKPGSRGDLARRFLAGDATGRDFVSAIDGDRYAGFNFIAYDGEELIYASNRTGEVRALPPGVYGLTNTRLGARLLPNSGKRDSAPSHQRSYEEWPKAVLGAAALHDIAAQATPDDLLALRAKPLLPLETPADRELAPERSYSPCFIRGAEYGTRASTAIIMSDESLAFVERQYGPFGKPGARSATMIDFSQGPAAQARINPRSNE